MSFYDRYSFGEPVLTPTLHPEQDPPMQRVMR